MSINVTVSGNPVCIKKGKMVTADPDYAKREFDKRRRLRLEQVRHQSKGIAENVRNKVRKEKKKQLSDFEKQEEEKLKKWQNRKLLELQEQYCESLNDIGLGHAQAVVESTQDVIEEQYTEKLKQKTQERGEAAVQKLQTEKTKKNLKQAIPLQHKKLTRDIENARSAMVSKSRKTPSKKRKKKSRTHINITSNLVSDSTSESEDYEALNLSSTDFDSSDSETHKSGARRKRTKSKSPVSTTSETSSRADSPAMHVKKTSKHVQKNKPASPKRPKSPPHVPIPSTAPKTTKSPIQSLPKLTSAAEYPMDTRISDRIRSRRFLLTPTELETRFEIGSDPHICVDLQGHAEKRPVTIANTQTDEIIHPTCKCTCNRQSSRNLERKELPDNPKVKNVTKIRRDETDEIPYPTYKCMCNRQVEKEAKQKSAQSESFHNLQKKELPLKPTVSLSGITKRGSEAEKKRK